MLGAARRRAFRETPVGVSPWDTVRGMGPYAARVEERKQFFVVVFDESLGILLVPVSFSL